MEMVFRLPEGHGVIGTCLNVNIINHHLSQQFIWSGLDDMPHCRGVSIMRAFLWATWDTGYLPRRHRFRAKGDSWKTAISS